MNRIASPRVPIVVVSLLVALSTSAMAATGGKPAAVDGEDDLQYDAYVCGPLTNAYGPFDYRTATRDERKLVESFHSDPALQNMHKGEMMNERGFIWNDFDYTLRAFPNHPASLAAIDTLATRLKSDKPPRAARSALCYFLRAIAFRPDDGTVRVLYGLYLLRRNKLQEAIAQLTTAENLMPDDRNIQYNVGLAYFRLKDYDRAYERAVRAYQAGFPLPGLKNLLKGVGKWKEPPPRRDPDEAAQEPPTAAPKQ